MTTATATRDFILAQLESHKAQHSTPAPPLVVAIQGPQGCGKSYLCTQLPTLLAPNRIVSISLDDLYLPHIQLEQLALLHSTNKLFSGRGVAGTHDLPLALSLFLKLIRINEVEGEEVELPRFDKSLFEGQGDRVKSDKVKGPVDVIILEGWMTLFAPSHPSSLPTLYHHATRSPKLFCQTQELGYDNPFVLNHTLEELKVMEEYLRGYQGLWNYVETCVQIKPQELGYTWEWRLEEHEMKLKNGGQGMTDEEIKSFISRYMPSYELYLGSIYRSGASWSGKGLVLVVGRDRNLVRTEQF